MQTYTATALLSLGLLACVFGQSESKLLSSPALSDPSMNLTTSPPRIPQIPVHDLTVIEENVWPYFNSASFDQDKVISFGDYQYTVYWDANSQLTVGRRRIDGSEPPQTVHLPESLPPDSQLDHRGNKPMNQDGHNNSVLGVSPGDGRLHLSYANWSSPLNYTRSVADFLTDPPATIEPRHFEARQPMTGNDSKRAAYPRFFNDPDGSLFMHHRHGSSGHGWSFLLRYDDASGSWNQIGPGPVFAAEGDYAPTHTNRRNAYLDSILSDRSGRFHVAWTWREQSHGHDANHGLHYAYSDDCGETWHNNAGEIIGRPAANEGIGIESPGIIVADIPIGTWNINQCGMTLDSKAQPHVVKQHLPVDMAFFDGRGGYPSMEVRSQLRLYHYYRDVKGDWQVSEALPPPPGMVFGPRPDIVIDRKDNLLIYWPSREKKGIFGYVATASTQWTDWALVQLGDERINSKDGLTHDRNRLRNEGILSFYIDSIPGSKTSDSVIVDFRMSDILAAALKTRI